MHVPTRLNAAGAPVIDRSAEVALLNSYLPGLAQYLQGRPVAATMHLTGSLACLASVAWTGAWSTALLGSCGVAAWSLLDGLWYERRRRRHAAQHVA